LGSKNYKCRSRNIVKFSTKEFNAMKIVFLIHKTNFHKFYYSIVKEALVRDFEVECWNYNTVGSEKKYLMPGNDYLPNFNTQKIPKIKTFSSTQDLEKQLLEDNAIDFVFTLVRPEIDFDKSFLDQATFRWVTLMGTGPDDFVNIADANKLPIASKRPGFLFVSSRHWEDKGKKFFIKFRPHLSGFLESNFIKTRCVGQPELDTCSKIDPDYVRSKYGIPKGKYIFLYLPFPYYLNEDGSKGQYGVQWPRAYCGIWGNRYALNKTSSTVNRFGHSIYNILRKGYHFGKIIQDPLALKWFLRGLNEGKTIQSIKEFCQLNDLFLVVKPRLKHIVPTKVQKTADLMVWDKETEHNPTALKEFLSISKVVASYYSHSVLTAAFMNVFHLNIVTPKEFFLCFGNFTYGEMIRYWLSEINPSIFSFDRVSESWPIENLIQTLPQTPLKKFTIDPKQRTEYVKKFIGFDDFNSCKRILDILENDPA